MKLIDTHFCFPPCMPYRYVSSSSHRPKRFDHLDVPNRKRRPRALLHRLRSEDGDDGDEEVVEAARRQRRRRRPRPHGHPRAGGAGQVAGAEAGAPEPPLEARLCGVPPRLRGLPRLLQLPPCLVSLGAGNTVIDLERKTELVLASSPPESIKLITQRYHAYFMEDLPAPMVIVADWIATLACLFAVKGLLASNASKKWMWYSFYVSMVVATFWTYYLLKLPRIRWDVVWLPFGPLIGSALSLYVDHTLLKSMHDISTLRSYMYNFKSL